MIGSLFGIVEYISGNEIILNVRDVGYKIYLAQTWKLKLNSSLKFFIHTHVKEDAFELYGFETVDDLKLFEKLINISGIGPKTAMGIFTKGTRDQILQAIEKEQLTFFTGIPRLGTKNAQKIIIELKGKLTDLSFDKNSSDLAKALLDLGFKDKEIRAVVENIDNSKTLEEQLKIALKFLAKK